VREKRKGNGWRRRSRLSVFLRYLDLFKCISFIPRSEILEKKG